MASLIRSTEPRNLRGEIERIFDEFNTFWPVRTDGIRGVWAPAVDIKETANDYVVTAELPGMNKDDIHVEVENDVLTIKGERKLEKKEEGENYHFIERSYGSFFRSFTLPGSVKANAISAEYKDGVLKLTMPKAEQVKPKQVVIKG